MWNSTISSTILWATTWRWTVTSTPMVVEAMNTKLNALIQKELGEDAGQMLPGGVDGDWVVTGAAYDV
jgi:hypothetical protein